MSTQNRRIFLVCGATGRQGESICRALMKTGKYQVRGITHDINSDKSRELKNLGVEMFQCDMKNRDQLRNAMKGAEIVYGVTDFWSKEVREKEYEIGKCLVDCCKEHGVKHFIWSSLPNVEQISGGKFNVPHFTNKARVGEYAKKLNLPTTIVMLGFYYQNFAADFILPHKHEADGTLVYTLPKLSAIPGVDVYDLGEIVKNICENLKEMNGKCIPLAGESVPLQKYLDQMQESCGFKVRLNPISFKEFAKLKFECAQELADMFEWMETYGYFGNESDLSLGKSLGQLKTWRQYLQTTKINPK